MQLNKETETNYVPFEYKQCHFFIVQGFQTIVFIFITHLYHIIFIYCYIHKKKIWNMSSGKKNHT